MAQGLTTLVEAARLAGPEKVWVRIAGGGAEETAVRAAVRRADVTNVELLGTVPERRVPQLYEWADVGAVLLRDRPIFAAALPTKLLEVLASARPVVLAARGESAALVDEAQAGVVVPPDDPQALAGALSRLVTDRHAIRTLGAAGRDAAERWFSREENIDRWERLLLHKGGRMCNLPGRSLGEGWCSAGSVQDP